MNEANPIEVFLVEVRRNTKENPTQAIPAWLAAAIVDLATSRRQESLPVGLVESTADYRTQCSILERECDRLREQLNAKNNKDGEDRLTEVVGRQEKEIERLKKKADVGQKFLAGVLVESNIKAVILRLPPYAGSNEPLISAPLRCISFVEDSVTIDGDKLSEDQILSLATSSIALLSRVLGNVRSSPLNIHEFYRAESACEKAVAELRSCSDKLDTATIRKTPSDPKPAKNSAPETGNPKAVSRMVYAALKTIGEPFTTAMAREKTLRDNSSLAGQNISTAVASAFTFWKQADRIRTVDDERPYRYIRSYRFDEPIVYGRKRRAREAEAV